MTAKPNVVLSVSEEDNTNPRAGKTIRSTPKANKAGRKPKALKPSQIRKPSVPAAAPKKKEEDTADRKPRKPGRVNDRGNVKISAEISPEAYRALAVYAAESMDTKAAVLEKAIRHLLQVK